jgi:hypothetical protein
MSDTKQILLDISYDCIDSLVRNELRESKQHLEREIQRRQKGSPVGVFHQDVDLDIKELEECIKSVDKILSWY